MDRENLDSRGSYLRPTFSTCARARRWAYGKRPLSGGAAAEVARLGAPGPLVALQQIAKGRSQRILLFGSPTWEILIEDEPS